MKSQPGQDDVTDLSFIDAAEVPPMNDMALVSFLTGLGGWVIVVLGLCSTGSAFAICCLGIALLSWVAAVFCGSFALREIAERGDNGRTLALWGLGSGAVGAGLAVTLVILLVLSAMGLISLGLLEQMGVGAP